MATAGMAAGRHAGWIAAVGFALVLGAADIVLGARLLADLGAVDAVHAGWWNGAGFVLPGVLVACFAFALEAPMQRAGARRGGRIGSTLLLLSGVCFAAQGLIPYDPAAPDAQASRLHVIALSLCVLAFLPAVLLITASTWHAPRWRALRSVGSVLAVLVLIVLLRPSGVDALHPVLLQRLLLSGYFGWIALASVVTLRAARDDR